MPIYPQGVRTRFALTKLFAACCLIALAPSSKAQSTPPPEVAPKAESKPPPEVAPKAQSKPQTEVAPKAQPVSRAELALKEAGRRVPMWTARALEVAPGLTTAGSLPDSVAPSVRGLFGVRGLHRVALVDGGGAVERSWPFLLPPGTQAWYGFRHQSASVLLFEPQDNLASGKALVAVHPPDSTLWTAAARAAVEIERSKNPSPKARARQRRLERTAARSARLDTLATGVQTVRILARDVWQVEFLHPRRPSELWTPESKIVLAHGTVVSADAAGIYRARHNPEQPGSRGKVRIEHLDWKGTVARTVEVEVNGWITDLLVDASGAVWKSRSSREDGGAPEAIVPSVFARLLTVTGLGDVPRSTNELESTKLTRCGWNGKVRATPIPGTAVVVDANARWILAAYRDGEDKTLRYSVWERDRLSQLGNMGWRSSFATIPILWRDSIVAVTSEFGLPVLAEFALDGTPRALFHGQLPAHSAGAAWAESGLEPRPVRLRGDYLVAESPGREIVAFDLCKLIVADSEYSQ